MTKVYSGIPPPQWKTSDLRWPKSTLEYPSNEKLKNSDLRWPKFTPEYPPVKTRLEMTKVYSIPPHKWKTSDLRWPKFTLEYPPNEKLQIWDDQSLLWNTPQWKTSDLMTKEYLEYRKTSDWDDSGIAPKKNFWFEMTKVYSGIPPQWKTRLHQRLLWNTMKNFWFEIYQCPPRKTSDLRSPKFTPEYPPTLGIREIVCGD